MAEFHRNTPGQDVPMREQIARRAYEIYEQRGREDGRDMEDWLAAEGELRNRNLTRPQPISLAVQASSATGSRRRPRNHSTVLNRLTTTGHSNQA